MQNKKLIFTLLFGVLSTSTYAQEAEEHCNDTITPLYEAAHIAPEYEDLLEENLICLRCYNESTYAQPLYHTLVEKTYREDGGPLLPPIHRRALIFSTDRALGYFAHEKLEDAVDPSTFDRSYRSESNEDNLFVRFQSSERRLLHGPMSSGYRNMTYRMSEDREYIYFKYFSEYIVTGRDTEISSDRYGYCYYE